jgi:hypothetical protein
MLSDDQKTELSEPDDESEHDSEPDIPIWQTLAEDTPQDEIHRLQWQIHSLKEERWIFFVVGIIAGLVLAAVLAFLGKSGLL